MNNDIHRASWTIDSPFYGSLPFVGSAASLTVTHQFEFHPLPFIPGYPGSQPPPAYQVPFHQEPGEPAPIQWRNPRSRGGRQRRRRASRAAERRERQARRAEHRAQARHRDNEHSNHLPANIHQDRDDADGPIDYGAESFAEPRLVNDGHGAKNGDGEIGSPALDENIEIGNGGAAVNSKPGPIIRPELWSTPDEYVVTAAQFTEGLKLLEDEYQATTYMKCSQDNVSNWLFTTLGITVGYGQMEDKPSRIKIKCA